MPTITHRGWTWIDEDAAIDERELARISARAEALANRWSALHAQDEAEAFQRMSYREDNEEDPLYAGLGEDCPSRGQLWRHPSWLDEDACCPSCGGGVLREAEDAFWCPPCQREGSLDEVIDATVARAEQAVEDEVARRRHERRVHDEEIRVEMEFCEAQLAAMGCRMQRAYEHMQEDEAYYRYHEETRFGHYSD